jgi:hypothetical protein
VNPCRLILMMKTDIHEMLNICTMPRLTQWFYVTDGEDLALAHLHNDDRTSITNVTCSSIDTSRDVHTRSLFHKSDRHL